MQMAPIPSTIVLATPVVDPSVFSWLNPTLGTALNGERYSRSLRDGVAALRVALAGAGLRLGEETAPPAVQVMGSTTVAFRLAVGDVSDMAATESPHFQVGVQLIAEITPDQSTPGFRIRAVAQRMNEHPFLVGEYHASGTDVQVWADLFCQQLTTAVTP